ncbi:MAG: copper amine oxidase N-terminal domain-containing protein [Candidatus Eremiobacteraeota bacterium]|nr:copper amine oxidase N-terminal domain-containing protein [Candidatus Eremiobacteraeota bacterium]
MNAFCFEDTASARIARLILAAALAFGSVAAPLAAPAQNVSVIIDGQPMSFDQPPIVRAGRVFVPMRAIFERLGASVVYANGQINATGRGRTVSLTIGSTQATVDGQPTTLDVAPFLVGARTLVPLRFIAQSLGATVNWNDSTSTVTINSGGGAPAPPPQREVTLVYQWPTGTIYNHYPQIRFQVNRPVRIGSVQVMLDGRDISGGLQTNAQYFFSVTPFSLGMGNHRVRVYGRTAGGIPFDLNWSFYQASY